MFVALPGLLLAISAVGDASLAGGVILFLLFLGAVAGFVYYWVWMEGCYKVLSKEQREEGLAELAKAQAEVLGEEADCLRSSPPRQPPEAVTVVQPVDRKSVV